ncbi:ATPase/DNA packaging protein [Bartonella sp. CL46QHWL]|uniref:ATPase/DNA packaging protein n=2 Tax=unclassified Bartonella TaxID=2645622 RepID=UPI0035D04CB6
MSEVFIYEPHNMLISGVTNCGKTYFALDLLEKDYRNKFENVVIFCPTYFNNKTYERKWIYLDKKVFIIHPEAISSNFDSVLHFATQTFAGSKTLFLIDDCANLRDTKKKVSELCNLAFSGRHYNISVWLLVQKYNSVVKDFRENIRILVLFFNKDESAMKDALEENSVIPKEKRQYYIEELKMKKGSKLIIRLQHPFGFTLSHQKS